MSSAVILLGRATQRQPSQEGTIRITGQFTIPAAPVAVWAIMMDPDALCRLAASCEEARQVSATRYEGVIRARVALFTFRARITGEVLEQEPPGLLRVAVVGESSGIPGGFRGTAELTLHEQDGVTHGEYQIEGDVLGRLGGMGQPILQITAQRLANTFAAKVTEHLRCVN